MDDTVGGELSMKIGVFYCGPSPLERSILVHVIRTESDRGETLLFEGHTTPGLSSGSQELVSATIPYDAASDCVSIEVDPFEEIEDCAATAQAPRCNLYPHYCSCCS